MKNVIKKINEDKELLKAIEKVSYYSVEQFVKDCQRYIKAIKEGRMLCNIESVSSSGMSRRIKFLSCEHGKYGYAYLNYHCLFLALGYTTRGDKDSFSIGGCGMDMIFHTNYTNIHRFGRIGLLTQEQVRVLAQKTPTTI